MARDPTEEEIARLRERAFAGIPEMPEVPKFLLEAALYAQYKQPAPRSITVRRESSSGAYGGPPPAAITRTYLDDFVAFKGPLDAYCLGCKRESIFHGESEVRGSRVEHTFACRRDGNHRLFFLTQTTKSLLWKIGQQPSLADLAQAEIGQYRKALRSDLFAEFNRAIGLSAHDVHIGAFVYLRRVFERLIEDAHEEAAKDLGWDEDLYAKSRIEERIVLLRDHLPTFLVENHGLYGILSKGIHELSEQECGRHFAVVRAGIEFILDEQIERERREAKLKEARDAIARVKGEIQGPAPARDGQGTKRTRRDQEPGTS